jgi:hypothetical protein
VEEKGVEGGESALKLYAQQYKSSSDSAHKLLIQFQRYFSFSSQIFLFFTTLLFPFKE